MVDRLLYHAVAGAWTRVGGEEEEPPPPVSTWMTPPAGTVLVNDLTRRANWFTESSTATVNELSGELGPQGDVILRSTVVDGQTGAGSAVPNERSDLAGPSVPLNSTRWMLWHERFITLPTTSLDRWQILGPAEIHDSGTLSQAPVMPEVSPSKRRRLNANAGLPTTRYFDIGPIVLGEWHQMKFGVFYTNQNTGWIEWWRDGVRVIRIDGQTTAENAGGYWKLANYRNADINGTTTYDTSGCRVYRP